jgi:hypothetical protein
MKMAGVEAENTWVTTATCELWALCRSKSLPPARTSGRPNVVSVDNPSLIMRRAIEDQQVAGVDRGRPGRRNPRLE